AAAGPGRVRAGVAHAPAVRLELDPALDLRIGALALDAFDFQDVVGRHSQIPRVGPVPRPARVGLFRSPPAHPCPVWLTRLMQNPVRGSQPAGFFSPRPDFSSPHRPGERVWSEGRPLTRSTPRLTRTNGFAP